MGSATLYESAAYHVEFALTAHLFVKLSHDQEIVANLGPWWKSKAKIAAAPVDERVIADHRACA